MRIPIYGTGCLFRLLHVSFRGCGRAQRARCGRTTVPPSSSPPSTPYHPLPSIMEPLFVFALLFAFIAYLIHSNKQTNTAASAASSAMGCASSSSSQQQASDRRPVRNPNAAIENNYNSLAEVEAALRRAGLESSDLILASDTAAQHTLHHTSDTTQHMHKRPRGDRVEQTGDLIRRRKPHPSPSLSSPSPCRLDSQPHLLTQRFAAAVACVLQR